MAEGAFDSGAFSDAFDIDGAIILPGDGYRLSELSGQFGVNESLQLFKLGNLSAAYVLSEVR